MCKKVKIKKNIGSETRGILVKTVAVYDFQRQVYMMHLAGVSEKTKTFLKNAVPERCC